MRPLRGASHDVLARLALTLAAGLLTLSLWACSWRGLDVSQRTAPAARAQPVLVYVVRRKWHIDVGFAAADVEAPLRAVASSVPRARYLLFGFGDRHYLLARDRRTPDMLAALWPGPALILLTSIENSPAQAFGARNVIALPLSASQSRAMQAFIWNTLLKPTPPSASPVDPPSLAPLAAGPYEDSLYFEAIPHYSGLHTCNTWAAEALRSAGLPLHSAGVLFASQLWAEVRRLDARSLSDRP